MYLLSWFKHYLCTLAIHKYNNENKVSATFEGNRQTKKILGNMEHWENTFSIFGEQSNFITGPCTHQPVRASMVDNSAQVQT